MARRTSRPPQRWPTVNLALQAAHVVRRFRGFACRREDGGLVCRGKLQPRRSSPTYRVRVDYRLGKAPTVRVTAPRLVPRAPHVYADGTLCLYWPKEWRWRQDDRIAETVLPWAASWLLYYELWLDTGEWLGPSSHGPGTEKTEDDRAA